MVRNREDCDDDSSWFDFDGVDANINAFEIDDNFDLVECEEAPFTKEKCQSIMNDLSIMMERLETRDTEEHKSTPQSDAPSAITNSDTIADTDSLYSELKRKQDFVLKKVKTMQVEQIIRHAEAAEKVDLAFILDCTVSMKKHIDDVKVNIRSIVERLRKSHRSLCLRLALVGYRDIRDGDDRFEVFDFTSDVNRFQGHLASLRAFGGEDPPEDIAGAVQVTNNQLTWCQPTRIALLIADYPCHGKEFHDDLHDDYPSGTPGIDIREEFRVLSQNFQDSNQSMSLYFGRITKRCDKMIDSLNDSDIEIEAMDIAEPDQLISLVTTSVRNSIFKTMTVSGRLSQHPSIMFSHHLHNSTEENSNSTIKKKIFAISEERLSTDDWENKDPYRVKVYRNSPIISIDQLKKPIRVLKFKKFLSKVFPSRQRKRFTKKNQESTMLMRRSTEPFAEGEQRIVFHAQLSTLRETLGLDKSAVVLKSFKHIGGDVNHLNNYFEHMEASSIACFLARKFNESPLRPKDCAMIEFLQVCVIEEDGETDSSREKSESRFCAENLLDTSKYPYTRFSNNLGYWNEDFIDKSLIMFTIWTHTITDGYLIVSDLQGIKKGNTFKLSDPAILCTDQLRFGSTNLGPKGIEKCIKNTTSLGTEKG